MLKKCLAWSRDHAPAIICAVLYAGMVLLSRPFAEIGIEDDWSYVRSAQVLSQTGRIVYNGWATAMLGPQLYLGALAFRLFGFSFTIARASVLLTGVLSTILLHRVLLRFGLNRFNATAATLVLMLAPIIQPLSFTFHSDIPGLLFVLLGLYFSQRAVQDNNPGRIIVWLALASACGVIGGSIRQIVWLIALVMVPSAAWIRRRERGITAAAAGLWTISFFAIVLILHWFNVQPYSVPEQLKTGPWSIVPKHLLRWGGGLVLGFPLLVAPFFLAIAWRFPYRRRPVAAALFAACSIMIPLLTMRHSHWLAPYAGNILSARGLMDNSAMLGDRPLVLTTPVRFITSVTTIFVGLVTARVAIDCTRANLTEQQKLAWRTRLSLLVPFSVAYVFLLLPRASFGVPLDRYLIPLTVLTAACVVQMYQDFFGKRLPAPALGAGAALALCGLVGMHDLFAFERGRLEAIHELREGGVSRENIGGGFEYDAWTQVTTVGTMSDPRIRVPRPIAPYWPEWRSGTCHNDTEYLESGVHPTFYLSLDPKLCSQQSHFPRVLYRPWFSSRSIPIFILKADQPEEWRNDENKRD